MKVGIIAPSSIPFIIGGAENLWWGLQNYINSETPHQCELIKIRIKEDDFWSLIDSYYAFFRLDLSDFDLIISSKYPAWMVSHPNHIIYMMHHLRGLFDTYPASIYTPLIYNKEKTGFIPEIVKILRTSNFSTSNINSLFSLLFLVKKEISSYPRELFQFPGPLIRAIIHFFDSYALHPTRIKKYYGISKNVISRPNYFPDGVIAQLLYPPPQSEGYFCASPQYLFTASRLDPVKRIDMLIMSMKYVQANISLLIAGTGPEEKNLRNLAKGDPRIKILGYVSQEEMKVLFSKALTVLFAPYDEDYGLVTIEAMKSRKPVITTNDSGGPLEFVEDGITGYIAEPNPKSIGEKINCLLDLHDAGKKLGMNGSHKVESITWKNTVNVLLSHDTTGIISNIRSNILILTTYPCYPPRGGGQHRIYHIYLYLSHFFNITLCSIVEINKPYSDTYLNPHFRQISIPQSREHAYHQDLCEKKNGNKCLYDVCMIDLIEKTPEYITEIQKLIKTAQIIVFSQPYLFPLVKYVKNDQYIIYDSQNVEYSLKNNYLSDSDLLHSLFITEKEICLRSDLILTASKEDKNEFVELYQTLYDKYIVIPNGVDTSFIRYISEKEKQDYKSQVGLYANTALFVGSSHPPNFEALQFINNKLAPIHKDWIFLIIGGIIDYSQRLKTRKNVLFFGIVSEIEKYELYKLADLAINPMISGSGTNLKILDYLSAGIPTITTPIGARGLEIESNMHAIVCDLEKFSENLIKVVSNPNLRHSLSTTGRELIEKLYDWAIIAEHYKLILSDLQK